MSKAKGAPVDQVLAKDFVQARFFYLGVPKNAPNPNAAKAFVTFMMTPEGQKLAWETWAEDLHMFPESNIGKQINALNPRVLDIAWTNAHPETGEAREKILKVMRVADK
jgi:ABC-type Fe3+ transport system substrate-binding protein